ncbi:amino acid ABC transporter permease [Corynebacterium caspium]|uniref:amino acid ABC transporter permease n=1 Tax=Corynebacterium caspium TaxID=234828 RepID=UPI0003629D9E|nr:amino acid ABC transporter permease [Corynebacterium caspium]WKD59237.1 putative glutamine ABC transporter permease protein GlnP [Corynebacterium caspium DSM 44850]
MTVRATVLYDAPGPKGRRLNTIITTLTAAFIALAIAWILWTLNNKGQLAAKLWTPFINPNTWTTYLLPGLKGTVLAAIASILFAIIFGVLFGLGRLSENRLVRIFCGIIVELFRAIPVLLLMIFAYQMFAVYNIVPSRKLGFSAVVFALTLYNGSVIAEILRAGINSLPSGQTEAAKALGLSHRQIMYRILLPQATAAMLPALISQMIIALKDSALGYQIGYVEVVRSGIQSASYNKNFFASLVIVAIIMIAINWMLTKLAERIEHQLRAGRARKNIVAKVPHHEDQGLETKDQVNADWHNPQYKEIRNPAE